VTDEDFMLRAIEVAWRNHGLTRPNPSVGCVLVADGTVLAEAATAPGGRPHAEEQALLTAGEAARGSVAYVTLEPCGARSSGADSCAALLARAGVARVVTACEDPSPYASGQGVRILRDAGVEVRAGFLSDVAAALYEGWLEQHRPV